MPIKIKIPPKASRAALYEGHHHHLEPEERDSHAFMAVGHSDAVMVPHPDHEGLPHEVFTVTLEDLAGRRGLARAAHVTWRYMGGPAGAATKASEVAHGGKGGGHTFASTNEGPFVAQTLEMLQIAARMKKVRDGHFRPCLLRIPGLYVVALWLKSEDGLASDVIIPMAPCHEALKPGRAYSAEQLHKHLQKPAQEFIEMHNRLDPEE